MHLSVLADAGRCAVAVVGLVARRRLAQPRDRVGTTASLPDGRTFTVFRETVRDGDEPRAEPVALHVWFHLRGVPAGSRRRRWLFERSSVVNTLLFAGFEGFRVKRWMVDPGTADYAGLYDWDGHDAADRYGRYITAVLRPLSEPGSVGYGVSPVGARR